ncbi:GNAT family N-acetyltransferase [Clostridium sp.]|uniref:GNAT family N-acetyltransferase n=1 Tax=Clostridium sp. TaxID=1506 RepID=UPI002FCC911C
MINIYGANVCDSKVLTNLAIRSEAYWGYDFEFMENFKAIYKVSEEFISNNPTFIMKEDENIIGFYGLLIEKSGIALEYFFIEPKYIGKGYGKELWKHVMKTCESLDVVEFEIVTSPQAKDFYIKLGAKLQGEVESLVAKGRIIPRLIYRKSN